MTNDKLFLLKPGFHEDGEGPFFCAACALVEGMLSFYPQIRDEVDVEYVDFPRPRPQIVSVLGEENQSAPVLVLAPGSQVPELVETQEANGHRFIDDENQICHYLAARFATATPHGSLVAQQF